MPSPFLLSLSLFISISPSISVFITMPPISQPVCQSAILLCLFLLFYYSISSEHKPPFSGYAIINKSSKENIDLLCNEKKKKKTSKKPHHPVRLWLITRDTDNNFSPFFLFSFFSAVSISCIQNGETIPARTSSFSLRPFSLSLFMFSSLLSLRLQVASK